MRRALSPGGPFRTVLVFLAVLGIPGIPAGLTVPGGVPALFAQVPPARDREVRLALLRDQVLPGEPLTVALGGEGLFTAEGPRPRAVLVVGGQRVAGAFAFPLGEDQGGGDGGGGADGGLGGVGAAGGGGGRPPWGAALLGVPSTVRPGPALVRCEAGDTLLGELALTIGERQFTAEEIPLDQANTELRTLPDLQKTREAERLWAILGRTGLEVYGTGPFVPPVSSTRRTSFFGDRRVFIYTDGSRDTAIHAGVDYGVPRGTVVGACGEGKVVLARSRIVTGNSVVIEHLPGLYSLYYHLDSIDVEEGQMVGSGERIGGSGDTGLATGPHLHWEIRASGENTDPDAFLGRPVIDREAILSTLKFQAAPNHPGRAAR